MIVSENQKASTSLQGNPNSVLSSVDIPVSPVMSTGVNMACHVVNSSCNSKQHTYHERGIKITFSSTDKGLIKWYTVMEIRSDCRRELKQTLLNSLYN